MFYSNNDSYMQDLYYYNQIPNNTFLSGLGNSIVGNMAQLQQAGMSNIPNNQMFMNQGVFSNSMQVQNLNSLYPSIYRILTPVISRIVSNNNQLVTEDLLNNMTDTVFNIVEGQIDLGDDQIQRNNNNENQTINSNSSNNLSSNNSSNRNIESNRQNNQNIQSSNTRNNRNDSLFRDLIKILIIKELLHRNQFQRQYRK